MYVITYDDFMVIVEPWAFALGLHNMHFVIYKLLVYCQRLVNTNANALFYFHVTNTHILKILDIMDTDPMKLMIYY